MSPVRHERANPADLPQDVMLRALQRLAGVAGFDAALKTFNETHFTYGTGGKVAVTFVQFVGPWAEWRETFTCLHPEIKNWNAVDLEELLTFALCVNYIFTTTGQHWYPAEPTEHTIRTCHAAGVECSQSLHPASRRLAFDSDESETIHQGPDQ